MPVLGCGGVLELRRELPAPILASTEAVVSHANALDISIEGFWTGDKVWLWGPVGLPFDLNGDELPDVTSGWGMFYGSKYLLYGQRKTRLTNGSKKWFGSEDPFRRPTLEGVTDRIELYVYRDELDRLSFYRSFADALGGDPAKRLSFYAVDFRFLLISPAGSTGYQERLEPAYPDLGSYRLPGGTTEIALANVTTAALPEPTGLDDNRPWFFVAEMESWSLELDASDLDTSGIGERFGEATRARVTGGGQLNFSVDRQQGSAEADAMFLARLLITLEQGSTAEAVFHVMNKSLASANVAYKSSLLLTNCVTNTAAGDVIRGSARFVTVGRIRLDIN